MDTFGIRLERLIERRGTNRHTVDQHLKARKLRSRMFCNRAIEEHTHDRTAETYTALADLLGTTVEYLVAGRGPETLSASATTGEVPASSSPLTDEDREILTLARRLGYDEAMNRLLLVRGGKTPGDEAGGDCLP